jgi:DNA-binding NarL/FixJ family response regulator
MMRDIIEGAIESQADMQLVGRCTDSELESAVRRYEADVVILKESADKEVHRQLLVARPQLKVVVMTSDGRSASLFEFRRLHLAEPSAPALIGAIRALLQREVH